MQRVTNDLLREELQELAQLLPLRVLGQVNQHWGIEVEIDPPGFTVEAPTEPVEPAARPITALLRLNENYPHAKPDMFWVRPYVKLPSGAWPGAGEHFETHFGKRWQRFSWHLRQAWEPGAHRLATHYWPFVVRRLAEVS